MHNYLTVKNYINYKVVVCPSFAFLTAALELQVCVKPDDHIVQRDLRCSKEHELEMI